MNSKNRIDENFNDHVRSFLCNHDINCNECNFTVNSNDVNDDITIKEIELIIDSLKSGKSEGNDGIGNEMLKKSKLVLVPLLEKLFNKLLETGIFPNEWCRAIIVPVHKKGNRENPNNYRGISLLSSISKVFTKILNNRLVKWANHNGKLSDQQAGFRKGKGTIDHIFVLQALASKYLMREKGRFYSVFIDFSQAFDSVPHQHLFYSLLRCNMHGRVIKLLRNMYSKLKSSVSVNGELSEDFHCTVGTRQGCILSPFLFILYLNELIDLIKEHNCQGIYLDEFNPNITMLLYADDVVIIGDHIGQVQKSLNVLSEFCAKWGLKVNMCKTKAMVFRNGGVIKRNENLYLNRAKIENVSYYKYLGLTMSTRLSWSPAQSTLAAQARKAMQLINVVNDKCNYSFKSACEIFDKCVVPILTYGSEIWGTNTHYSIENVHYKFCKRQLGVGINAANFAVLGECGRDRMYVKCVVKCVKYWMKLLALPRESLLGSAYSFLYNQCLLGKHNWAYKVKHLLEKYGFGWIWANQKVYDEVAFIKLFSERIRDCELQMWNEGIHSVSKLKTYCKFKDNREEELYLSLPIPRRLRVALARFRISSHNLEVEIGRQSNISLEKRLCKHCAVNHVEAIEDEYHVVVECNAYDHLRQMYLGKLIVETPNIHNFVSLFKSSRYQDILSVANYIASVFKVRSLES